MSGGSYDYKYKELNNLADQLSPITDEFQELRNRTAKALRGLAEVCHDIEWIDSYDYGKDDWKKVEEWLDKHNF